MSKYKFDASQIANITWRTLDDLWAIGNPDTVCLYTRYCYIVNLRGNTVIHADNKFMKNGTKLSRDRLSKAKADLLKYGFIENVNKGRGGWWVKVNHLITSDKMKIAFNPYGMPVSVNEINAIPNPVIRHSATIYKDNNINYKKDIEEEEDREIFSHSNVIPTIPDATHANRKESTAIATVTPNINSVKDTVNVIYKLSIEAFNNKETERLTSTTIARTKKLLALGHTVEEFKAIFAKAGAWSQKTPRLLAVVVKNEQTFNGLLNFQDLRETESKNKITEIRSVDYVPDTEKVSKWDQYK